MSATVMHTPSGEHMERAKHNFLYNNMQPDITQIKTRF